MEMERRQFLWETNTFKNVSITFKHCENQTSYS